MRARGFLVIGGALLVVGCATGTDVDTTDFAKGGSGGDHQDAGQPETGTPTDGAPDVKKDGPVEAADAKVEAEVGPEAAPDVAPETAPEAAPDVAPEVSPEAAPDVAPETTDPCSGVVCNTPPVNNCKDANTLEAFNPTGVCSVGVCLYSSHDEPCTWGCSMGECKPDPCIGVTCTTPPAKQCSDATQLKVYDSPGTCQAGTCSYASHLEPCQFGCAGDACAGDPCIGVTCTTPPPSSCTSATVLRTFAVPGVCGNGVCGYNPVDTPCPHGCEDAACKECTVDADCTGSNWCNAGKCVACATDAHCGASCTDCLAIGQVCQGGTACGCGAATKMCGEACVSTSSPATGCSAASCDACPLPAHATATDCSGAGSTCGFVCDAALHRVAEGSACVCDAAKHFVEVGGACQCDTGYVPQGDTCQLDCPGTVVGSNCYWYESAAMTFDAAEAVCAGKSGHLASVLSAAENESVRALAASNAWIGLRDLQGDKVASELGDDCTDAPTIDALGGRYADSTTPLYDDAAPCSKSTNGGDDMFFRLDVTASWTWVFTATSSAFDPYLGLWTRGSGSGYTGCLSTSVECDDDDGPGLSSRIVRTLDPGSYMLIVDAADDWYGSFTLRARRFTFTDGATHVYQNWSGEEPNDSGSNEACAEINSSTGKWNDIPCSNTHPAVCKKPL